MSDPESNSGEKKSEIHVDEDWKSQAEAEKERLARQEQAASPKTGGAGPAGPAAAPGGDEAAPEADAGRLPPASFVTMVNEMLAQILFALGESPDPATGRRYRDLEVAKHYIDTLAVLERKTRGNLTEEEKRMLDTALYQVRMRYVQAAQMG
jgi:hypothetical protein